MNDHNPNRENTIDKINFSQNLVNWTIKDSIAETKVTLNNLKIDLNKLVLKENAKRNEHNHNRLIITITELIIIQLDLFLLLMS